MDKYKIIAHYDDMPASIQQTDHEPLALRLYDAKLKRRDCVAVFRYVDDKLVQYSFLRS